MDFSKLSQNEKLATYGSVAVLVGGLVGYSYGMTILAVLAAVAMLAIVFLPQLSAGTKLPGSRGSLMLIAGAVAGVILVLAFLLYIGTIFTAFDFRDLFFLLAVAGGVLMAWAGWREFQGEGGKFQVGTTPGSGGTAGAPPPASVGTTPASGGTAGAPPPASVEPSREPAGEPAPDRTADTSMDTAPPMEPPRSTDNRDTTDREDRPTS